MEVCPRSQREDCTSRLSHIYRGIPRISEKLWWWVGLSSFCTMWVKYMYSVTECICGSKICVLGTLASILLQHPHFPPHKGGTLAEDTPEHTPGQEHWLAWWFPQLFLFLFLYQVKKSNGISVFNCKYSQSKSLAAGKHTTFWLEFGQKINAVLWPTH